MRILDARLPLHSMGGKAAKWVMAVFTKVRSDSGSRSLLARCGFRPEQDVLPFDRTPADRDRRVIGLRVLKDQFDAAIETVGQRDAGIAIGPDLKDRLAAGKAFQWSSARYCLSSFSAPRTARLLRPHNSSSQAERLVDSRRTNAHATTNGSKYFMYRRQDRLLGGRGYTHQMAPARLPNASEAIRRAHSDETRNAANR